MSISSTVNSCERLCVKAARQVRPAWLVMLMVAEVSFTATAQTTNTPARTNAPPHIESAPPKAESAAPRVESTPPRLGSAGARLDESAFGMIAERNIFNANRSGGQVRLATRRAASVESFTLVGTMAYAKGAFAFFEGSSSEFTKVLKADGVIAGHKLADIFAGSVKLEADGKQIELPIGSQMRREDAGAWLVVAGVSGGDSSSRGGVSASDRSTTTEPAGQAPAAAAPTTGTGQSEILKRLMERREKE